MSHPTFSGNIWATPIKLSLMLVENMLPNRVLVAREREVDLHLLDRASGTRRVISVPLKITRGYGLAYPKRLSLGLCAVGARKLREVRIESLDGAPFCIEGCCANSPHVEVTWSTEPAATQWVTITFAPSREGRIDATVTCRTNQPEMREFSISVFGIGVALSNDERTAAD